MNGPIAVILIVLTSLIFTQVVKFLAYSLYSRRFRWDMLISTGGMPSSHSALVTSLFASILLFTIEKGDFSNAYYIPISLVLAMVVVHDSMGIRYEASKHAQLLNRIVNDLEADKKNELGYEKDLKEYLGHKPVEAMVGVLFGIIWGIIGFLILRNFF